ncbi:MAG: alpha-2-macroglobulin family protein [Magnetococcales bacterium]|nr:alpha-2-macroglobulin family protein [Magnetococcales bacterium]
MSLKRSGLQSLLFVLISIICLSGAAQADGLRVVEFKERALDGKSALSLLFSSPLSVKGDADAYITVDQGEGKPVDGAWVLGENRRRLYFPHVLPETSYRVQVVAGLTGENGVRLGVPFVDQLKTRSMDPAFGFASRGAVLPARLSNGLPIMTVNVPEVDVQFLRVKSDKLGAFLNQFYWTSQGRHWDTALDPMHVFTESVRLVRFETKAQANTRTITHLPVEDIPELKQPGLYIAVMSRPNRFGKYITSHFFISDIGLHLRTYAEGISLHAASLETGQPLSGVDVEILDSKGKLLEKGITDQEGGLKLGAHSKNNQVLVARQGAHLSFLSFREPALDLSAYEISGRPQLSREAFIYGPRDLYRPGEEIDFSVLLRDGDGRAVASQPLTAVLKKPGGKVAARKILPPQGLGYYRWQSILPEDAPTGKWELTVQVDPGAKSPLSKFRFHVEEFLPERMKLELESDQARLKPDEAFQVAVSGAYLYGAPAAGNRFKAVLNIHRDHHPVAALDDFFFGDQDAKTTTSRQELSDGPLDDQGRMIVTIPPAAKAVQTPQKIQLTGSLFETGGRPVTRSIARTIWPSEALVGVRPLYSGKHAEGDSTASFEIVKADFAGSMLPAKGLQVSVIHEERDYFWSYSEGGGWRYEHSESHYPVLERDLTLAPGKTGQIDVPVKYGNYRLEIRDSETKLLTRYRFEAGWNWQSRAASAQARPDRVGMALDKASYQAGDILQLTLTPPHGGEALIVVEGDRSLWQGRMDVPAEGIQVAIPVDESWQRHDLYISAVVFRPGSNREKITPNRAIGLIHLPLDRQARKLEVAVEVAEKSEPEKPLPISVNLPEMADQEVLVTVAAVDVGILNITDFATPDAHAWFFDKRRYGVGQRDLYGRVIESMDGVRAGMRFGGDAPLKSRSKKPHAEVKTVALFSGPVAVDGEGHAEVMLEVPDFNGALRVMVLAFGEEQFGTAEKEIIVAAPVIAEIAAPRFLAAGDQAFLTLDLTNASGHDQALQLQLNVTSPLAMAPVSETVSLGDGEKTTLRYPLTTESAYGVGKIQLRLTGKSPEAGEGSPEAGEAIALSRSWELMVRPGYPGERRVERQVLVPGAQWTMPDNLMDGLMPATAEVDLRLSSWPPLNLRPVLKGLLGYPYGCLEQTTSRAFPLLVMGVNKAQRLGLKPLSSKERKRRIEMAIDRLSGMQRPDGSFGLWRANDDPEIWLTPYVLDFLLDARVRGFQVPEAMMQKGLDYLLKGLRAGGRRMIPGMSEAVDHLRFAANSYAGYVLSRLGRAPLGALRILHDNDRKHALSGLPLVHLGLALKAQGDERRADEALQEAVDKVRKGDAYLGDYGSPSRDTALMIYLLQGHGHEIEDLPFRLDQEMGERRWFSTQERFALFAAGEALTKNSQQSWSGIIQVGEQGYPFTMKGDLAMQFNSESLAQKPGIISRAAFPLYGILETTGYGEKPPSEKSDILHITRDYYRMDGTEATSTIRSGDLLVVHLQVKSTKTMEHGLVVDLLPAGLEIENANLSQGESLGEVEIAGIKPAAAMAERHIRHLEYRDDRFVAAVALGQNRIHHLFYLVRVVSPGQFFVPPPFAEDMYNPDRYGLGASPGVMTVVDQP